MYLATDCQTQGFSSTILVHHNKKPISSETGFLFFKRWQRSGDGVHKFFSKIYSLAIFKIFVNSLTLINKNYKNCRTPFGSFHLTQISTITKKPAFSRLFVMVVRGATLLRTHLRFVTTSIYKD